MLVSAGVLAGGLAVHLAGQGLRGLDRAVAAGDRCDELARQADGRAAAVALLRAGLAGLTEAEVTARIGAAGLSHERYAQPDHIILVAGAGPTTAALQIVLRQGRVDTVLPLPGTAPCAAAGGP